MAANRIIIVLSLCNMFQPVADEVVVLVVVADNACASHTHVGHQIAEQERWVEEMVVELRHLAPVGSWGDDTAADGVSVDVVVDG